MLFAKLRESLIGRRHGRFAARQRDGDKKDERFKERTMHGPRRAVFICG
jgi:hypothetical protein